VVFLGSDFARKGLTTAMRSIVAHPHLELCVLGDGRPGQHARKARQLGVADRVRFLGAVAAPERYLRGAKAMVLPTRYDPSANATLEAMACGVPVISTALDGAAELLPEPWMVVSDPTDADSFAAGLSRVLDDPGLGGCCRAVAEAHGADVAYQQLLSVLEEAIA
jgi:UDP-glucose:(heptosyl)LPS alpha-1,3-glucosyltransferase